MSTKNPGQLDIGIPPVFHPDDFPTNARLAGPVDDTAAQELSPIQDEAIDHSRDTAGDGGNYRTSLQKAGALVVETSVKPAFVNGKTTSQKVYEASRKGIAARDRGSIPQHILDQKREI